MSIMEPVISAELDIMSRGEDASSTILIADHMIKMVIARYVVKDSSLLPMGNVPAQTPLAFKPLQTIEPNVSLVAKVSF